MISPIISFTKMHALGNDFVVINALKKPMIFAKHEIEQLSNRHFGIGFDQLLLIEPGTQADFFCRIFNADGSEAEQCGNGLRCVARYLIEEALHPSKQLTIATKAGVFPISIEDFNHIEVTLPAAHRIQTIPLTLENPPQSLTVEFVSLGNPHAILPIAQLNEALVSSLGAKIATHTAFPQGVNVGFMHIQDPSHIVLRTFERGVGETHACGSNAVAAVSAGIAKHGLNKTVEVAFRYGTLVIEETSDGHIKMTGPAVRVFDGNIK